MAIDMVKIRARITIGRLVVETPYILSFDVNLVRGQVSTFSASIKVSHDDIDGNIVGSSITIEAGENMPSETIFSGIVRKCQISPVFDDPSFVAISLSGEDILSVLRSKKYTRRCISTNSTWCAIDSVVRKGLRSGRFKLRKVNLINTLNADIHENSATVSAQTGQNISNATNGFSGSVPIDMKATNVLPSGTRG